MTRSTRSVRFRPTCARADLVTTPAAVLGLVDGEVAKARPSAAAPIRTRRELEAGLINLSQSIGFVEQAIKHSGVVAMAVG